jgi:hypothetical protein
MATDKVRRQRRPAGFSEIPGGFSGTVFSDAGFDCVGLGGVGFFDVGFGRVDGVPRVIIQSTVPR